MIGRPGVLGEVGFDEGGGGDLRGVADLREGDAFVMGGEGLQKFDGAEEEAGGGAEAASVDAVRGFAVMMLQMDEAAGELDEGFVKDVAFAVRTEPDVLEDVVRGVVAPRVEEPEVFEVARMPASARLEAGDLRGDLVVFAHGVLGQESTRRAAASAAKGGAGAGHETG